MIGLHVFLFSHHKSNPPTIRKKRKLILPVWRHCIFPAHNLKQSSILSFFFFLFALKTEKVPFKFLSQSHIGPSPLHQRLLSWVLCCNSSAAAHIFFFSFFFITISFFELSVLSEKEKKSRKTSTTVRDFWDENGLLPG